MKPVARAASLLVGLTLALSACGAAKAPTVAGSRAPAASDQTQVPVPAGITLTSYGTQLKFGQTATIADAPNDLRQTILEVTVLSATQGAIADLSNYTLDDQTQASTPYYVRVTVKNVGQGDVGQTPIPLYLVDNKNTLIQRSSFNNSFSKCPSTGLPVTFAPQATLTTCLVFLAPDHGTMTGVSFRAVQENAPILWTGTLTAPATAHPTTKKK